MGNVTTMRTARIILQAALVAALSLAQQALAQQTLFGLAHNGQNQPSTLYTIDPISGAATQVGSTDIGFNQCSGMDFHPQSGMLFATCERDLGSSMHVLITIDPATGMAREPKPTDVFSLTFENNTMSDISFRNSDNTLFGYFVPGGDLGTIDITTGQATNLGDSLVNTTGNGIAFSPEDTLFHGTNISFNTLDQVNGIATAGPNLNFSSLPASASNIRINAMDFQPGTGTLYASVNTGGGSSKASFLVTIDTMTGVVTNIGQTVNGLDAIAWAGGRAETSFSEFSIDRAKIKYRKRPHMRDRFKVKGRFTLDPNSNGVDLINEPVAITVGGSSLLIPGGSFVGVGSKMVFKGAINGSWVKMKIREKYRNDFRFEIKAYKVDLTGSSNPLEVTVRIGDDGGTTQVRLAGRLEFKKFRKFSRFKDRDDDDDDDD